MPTCARHEPEEKVRLQLVSEFVVLGNSAMESNCRGVADHTSDGGRGDCTNTQKWQLEHPKGIPLEEAAVLFDTPLPPSDSVQNGNDEYANLVKDGNDTKSNGVVALGSTLPSVGQLSLSATEHRDLRQWLTSVLEQHRTMTYQDIKSEMLVVEEHTAKTYQDIKNEMRTLSAYLQHPHFLWSAVGSGASDGQSNPSRSGTFQKVGSRRTSRNVRPDRRSEREWEKNQSERQAHRSNHEIGHAHLPDDQEIEDIVKEFNGDEQDSETKGEMHQRAEMRVNNVMRRLKSRGFASKTSIVTEEMRILVNACCPCFSTCLGITSREEKRMTKVQANGHVAADKLFKNAANAVASGRFDAMAGFLIMCNCIVMMVNLEYVGYRHEIVLGKRGDTHKWENAKDWFSALEHVFNALFLIELILRISVMGLSFITDASLCFDFLIVIGSSLQLYVLDPLEGSSGSKLSLLRMLRFVRFVRVLRLVRVLKLFSALRVLVKTVISSFGALIWSMLLLLLIMIMGGLFLSELLKESIDDESMNYDFRTWLFEHYGTSTRAIYTLFEVTLAGCWPSYFRPLINRVSGWFVAFAMAYITVVVFAIIRIITALFLKETLQVASNDAEMMVHERLKQKEAYVRKLEGVFRAVDASGDGRLNTEEFECIVENHMVKTWLQVLELEVHDAQALFRLLDNGDGEITYEEFLTGVLRLKGQARTMDVVSIMHSTDRTLEAVRSIQTQMNSLHRRFCTRPSNIETLKSMQL